MPRSSHRYLLVTMVDFRLFGLFDFFEELDDVIGATRLKESDLDGMVFIPERVGANLQMSRPIRYFKDPCCLSRLNGADCKTI